MSYALAVVIFCIGVIMDACVVFYIVNGNRKYKDVDPLAEDTD